jgi:tetrapyrrole methylase family protein/MazG family protein
LSREGCSPYHKGMEFDELVRIMEALRKGCPWDRQQTHRSLKPYLIEEAYELVEAIEAEDPARMKEELGDLLLQVLFHSELARERGDFDIGDVITAIGEKMIKRHPHVFGTEVFTTPEEVVGQWEERKREEGKLRKSLLEGVPRSMPSLLRAHRLQARAARAGFDWKRTEDVMEKLDEELSEFREAVRSGEEGRMEDELGDVFFVLVNISRFIGVSPEDALAGTIGKFMDRFRYMEEQAKQRGKKLGDMSLEEMDALWEEAKGK